MIHMSRSALFLTLAAALLATSCQNAPTSNSGAPAPAPAAPAAAKAAPTSNAPSREVTGLDGWTGTITGSARAGSRFERLQIGMERSEVVRIAGRPTSEFSHITGKAFIPYFYGSGGAEIKMAYSGLGRLILSKSARYSGNYHLIAIEHNAAEKGTGE